MAGKRVYRIEENHQQEEDDEEFGSLNYSRDSLQARVEKWTEETGEKACAIVYVVTECFHVHKTVISRCGYLKRQLTHASVVTVNPPLTITPATFLLIANFCYGAEIVLRPDNLAALRTAADLLEMTEDVNRGNLLAQAESFFTKVVVFDQDHAAAVLDECVRLMPEAETVASLPSRCLHVLGMFREGDLLAERVQAVRLMPFEHFKVVARKLRELLVANHDTLYVVIDQYIKGNMEKLTEEERSELCSLIDCVRLDSRLLIHAVQCPRMPLRFVVRAMFAEQINTRKSIISATSGNQPQTLNRSPDSVADSASAELEEEEATTTLGGILKRDAALRDVERIKREMDTTCAKIKLLEEELKGMRAVLTESKSAVRIEQEKDQQEDEGDGKDDLALSKVDAKRSMSLRMLTTVGKVNRVRRGERGSVSSASIRLPRTIQTTSSDIKTQRVRKVFGAKLMSGLKNVFWRSGPKEEREVNGCRTGRNAHFSPI
uniref:NPH3 domain-containing protein n=2 Tax=Kalanchoe fedtschenkoi TaxID=63787 RepID=A0A7N0TMF8_KALFE